MLTGVAFKARWRASAHRGPAPSTELTTLTVHRGCGCCCGAAGFPVSFSGCVSDARDVVRLHDPLETVASPGLFPYLQQSVSIFSAFADNIVLGSGCGSPLSPVSALFMQLRRGGGLQSKGASGDSLP